MESELRDLPFSTSRGMDVALHGVMARFRTVRYVRWSSGMVVVVTVGVTFVVAMALHQHSPEVPMKVIQTGGVGLPTNSAQVNDFALEFGSVPGVKVRFTKIVAVPLRGFPAPNATGAYFAPSFSLLFTMNGWPPRFPASAPQWMRRLDLREALGTPITLGRKNTLLVGYRAPRVGVAYAVSALKATYVHDGVVHTVVLSQMATPDVLCVTSSGGVIVNIPTWCSAEISAANAIARSPAAKMPSAHGEAQMVVNVAANYEDIFRRTVTLSEVRTWANRLFPPNTPWGIRSVSAIGANGRVFRFVVRNSTETAVISTCLEGDVAGAANGSILSATRATSCTP